MLRRGGGPSFSYGRSYDLGDDDDDDDGVEGPRRRGKWLRSKRARLAVVLVVVVILVLGYIARSGRLAGASAADAAAAAAGSLEQDVATLARTADERARSGAAADSPPYEEERRTSGAGAGGSFAAPVRVGRAADRLRQRDPTFSRMPDAHLPPAGPDAYPPLPLSGSAGPYNPASPLPLPDPGQLPASGATVQQQQHQQQQQQQQQQSPIASPTIASDDDIKFETRSREELDQYWKTRQLKAAVAEEGWRALRAAESARMKEAFDQLELGPVPPADTPLGAWASNERRSCQVLNSFGDFLPPSWRPQAQPQCPKGPGGQFSAVSESGKLENAGCDGTLYAVVANDRVDLDALLRVAPPEHRIYQTLEGYWRRRCEDSGMLGRCDPYNPVTYVVAEDTQTDLRDVAPWVLHRHSDGDGAPATVPEMMLSVCVPERAQPDRQHQVFETMGHDSARYELHLRHVARPALRAERARLYRAAMLMQYGTVDPAEVGATGLAESAVRRGPQLWPIGELGQQPSAAAAAAATAAVDEMDALDSAADDFFSDFSSFPTQDSDLPPLGRAGPDDSPLRSVTGAGDQGDDGKKDDDDEPGDSGVTASSGRAARGPSRRLLSAARDGRDGIGSRSRSRSGNDDDDDDDDTGDTGAAQAAERLARDAAAAAAARPSMTDEEVQHVLHDRKRAHDPLNVVVVVVQSLSHAHAVRTLPMTLAALRGLRKREKASLSLFEFSRHAALGDSAVSFLSPLLSSIEAAMHPTEAAWLWQLYQARGYVTAFLEEECPVRDDTLARLLSGSGNVAYAHTSLDDQEAAIAVSRRLGDLTSGEVMCPLQQLLAADAGFAWSEQSMCVGGRRLHELLLDYVEDMFAQYPDGEVGKMAVLNLREASEPSMDRASVLDAGLASFFGRLTERSPGTVLVLTSDHGADAGEYFRRSEAGKLEFRLPALFVAAPDALLDMYPEMRASLTANQDVLVSAFDLHETLRHVLTYPNPPVYTHLAAFESRGGVFYGGSLLEPLPPNRTCEDAGVPDGLCPCQQWRLASATDAYWLHLAQYAARSISAMAEASASGPCLPLRVSKLLAVWRQQVVDSSEKVRLELEVVAGDGDGRRHRVDVTVEERATNRANFTFPHLVRMVAGSLVVRPRGGRAQWYVDHPHVAVLGEEVPSAVQYWLRPDGAHMQLMWTQPDGPDVPAQPVYLGTGQSQSLQRFDPEGRPVATNDVTDTPGGTFVSSNGGGRLTDPRQTGFWTAELRMVTERPMTGAITATATVADMEAQVLSDGVPTETVVSGTAVAQVYVATTFDDVPDEVWSRFWAVHSVKRFNSKSSDCAGTGPPRPFCFC